MGGEGMGWEGRIEKSREGERPWADRGDLGLEGFWAMEESRKGFR